MKRSGLRKMLIVVVSSIIIVSALTVAEESLYKHQGSIMSIDLKKNTMIINERTCTWNQNTAFYDHKSSLIGIDRFRPKSIVYVEGTVRSNNVILIERIYLLPKYVGKKERHLYPFME